jgi:hypothetical protein
MKRNTLSLLALGASLVTSGILIGQGQSKTAAPADAAAKPQRLVRVATLNTVKANQEFQANVHLLQMQRQAAVELNTKIEQEKDAAKKKELKSQLDTLMAKLNENNNAMAKAYGFSLTRNYTMEIEKSNIYMLVTDEEAAQIEKVQKEQEKKEKKK